MTNSSLTKYPSTPHLRGSRSITKDDIHAGPDIFSRKTVVVTEKMDGENTTMYRDYIHARSVDSRHHPSRDWVKAFHASMCYNIPEGWRVCGENVYAKHSIFYDRLPSYFLGFSIWDQNDYCLSWANTLEKFEQWGITPVPVLYQGPYTSVAIQTVIDSLDETKQEGIVVRNFHDFHLSDFQINVAKYVRENHVQTDEHWTRGPVIPNLLV